LDYIQDHNLVFKDGFIFDAKDVGFKDVSSLALVFTIFARTEKIEVEKEKGPDLFNIKKQIERSYPLKIKKMNDNGTEMIDAGTIIVRECYNRYDDFCREKYKKEKKSRLVCKVSSTITTSKDMHYVPHDFLGYYATDSNRSLVLFSTVQKELHGINIVPKNFNDVICLFMATMVLIEDIGFLKDVFNFHTPQIDIPEEWLNDCIIISLFSKYSFQSSIRRFQTTNYGKQNIFNDFFFMSKDEMLNLALKYNFQEMIDDIKHFAISERYIFNLLTNLKLSDEALNILNTARNLFIKSFEVRESFNNLNPQYCLESWDAGYAQLKPILNKYYNDDLNKFTEQVNQLTTKLKARVWEFDIIK